MSWPPDVVPALKTYGNHREYPPITSARFMIRCEGRPDMPDEPTVEHVIDLLRGLVDVGKLPPGARLLRCEYLTPVNVWNVEYDPPEVGG